MDLSVHFAIYVLAIVRPQGSDQLAQVLKLLCGPKDLMTNLLCIEQSCVPAIELDYGHAFNSYFSIFVLTQVRNYLLHPNSLFARSFCVSIGTNGLQYGIYQTWQTTVFIRSTCYH
jgi:hypothetical protein